MNMNTTAEFYPGSLVSARGREWIVLPESTADTLRLRPLGGGDKDESLIYLPLESQPVGPASFPWPMVSQARNHSASQLLMDVLQLKLRSGAGPFRSFGNIAVEPRAYQLVPLLMAMKQATVRLLIAAGVDLNHVNRLGWTCLPSEANYFCARSPHPLNVEALRAQDIKLRDTTSLGLPGHWRLGVLPPAAQQALHTAVLETTKETSP